jgi:dipeptidyl aminopeptidase/acylaminoacyl peptidase
MNLPTQKKRHGGPNDLLSEAQDLTQTEQYKNVEQFWTNLHGPAFGKISDAADLAPSPDGTTIAFTGSIWNSLKGLPETRICIVDLASGRVTTITQGPYNDKLPKWSRDGKMIAFLSDRVQKGLHQLYALSVAGFGEAYALTSLEGVVEDFEWSPDGSTLLICLAPYGTTKSGFEGSGTHVKEKVNLPNWMPRVKANPETTGGRSIWLLEPHSQQIRQVSKSNRNVWKFVWCGSDAFVGLVSDNSREEAYEGSVLVKTSITDGSETTILTEVRSHAMGLHLLALLTSSKTGEHIALIDSVGGDRTKLAGSLFCINLESHLVTYFETAQVDVTWIRWLDEVRLLVTGIRGIESVTLEVNIVTKQVLELWASQDACGPANSHPMSEIVSGSGFAFVRQSWTRYPEIGIVDSRQYRTVKSFEHQGAAWFRTQVSSWEDVRWKSEDGLEIQGILYLPVKGKKPYPLILNVHGGPIALFLNQWLGYRVWVAFLVAQGYAVLNVNPRGSTGRGQEFTSMVINDVGGGDAKDQLSGVDNLVAKGIADPARLGVIGGSYGGYMTAWLTTVTTRFAAAIPISPVTDYGLQWLSSDLRQRILDNKPFALDGLYAERSPLKKVHHCTTPTLQLVGSLDSCTPPGQAHMYHTALLDHGVVSIIVEYPQEGHGVRQFPTLIDACSRMLSWFERCMPIDKD